MLELEVKKFDPITPSFPILSTRFIWWTRMVTYRQGKPDQDVIETRANVEGAYR